MSDCVECDSGDELIQHHTSYERDETVTVCRACHMVIHATPGHELYPEDEPDETSIKASGALADELFDRKRRGESYEDVIWRLMEEDDGGE